MKKIFFSLVLFSSVSFASKTIYIRNNAREAVRITGRTTGTREEIILLQMPPAISVSGVNNGVPTTTSIQLIIPDNVDMIRILPDIDSFEDYYTLQRVEWLTSYGTFSVGGGGTAGLYFVNTQDPLDGYF